GFGNGWSFQVLIAALLGGPGRPWGPAIGAVLLVLLSDFLVGTFSRYFTIALGVCFVVIVYFIPGGIAPRIEQLYGVFARGRQATRGKSGASAPREFPVDPAAADKVTGMEMREVIPRRSALHPLMRLITGSGPKLVVRDGAGPPPGAVLSVHGLRKTFGGLI